MLNAQPCEPVDSELLEFDKFPTDLHILETR